MLKVNRDKRRARTLKVRNDDFTYDETNEYEYLDSSLFTSVKDLSSSSSDSSESISESSENDDAAKELERVLRSDLN